MDAYVSEIGELGLSHDTTRVLKLMDGVVFVTETRGAKEATWPMLTLPASTVPVMTVP